MQDICICNSNTHPDLRACCFLSVPCFYAVVFIETKSVASINRKACYTWLCSRPSNIEEGREMERGEKKRRKGSLLFFLVVVVVVVVFALFFFPAHFSLLRHPHYLTPKPG